jgi:hypothetical protein
VLSSALGEACGGRVPEDRDFSTHAEDLMFYTLVFAGLAVLLVVAVLVQRSRRK